MLCFFVNSYAPGAVFNSLLVLRIFVLTLLQCEFIRGRKQVVKRLKTSTLSPHEEEEEEGGEEEEEEESK